MIRNSNMCYTPHEASLVASEAEYALKTGAKLPRSLAVIGDTEIMLLARRSQDILLGEEH